MKKRLMTILALLSITQAIAGEPKGMLTDKGIKNLGSGIGFVAHCEFNKHIPVGTITDYINTVKKNINASQAEEVIRIYQRSLSDKKIYAPSKDAWLPMSINKTECAKIFQMMPSITHFLESQNK